MSIYVDIRKKTGDFSLNVKFEKDSGTLALLGGSGCGKSMTLGCIAGIIKPDEGIIKINGNTVFDSEKKINLKPQKRMAGYLFQKYALFPNMTVKGNIIAGMERRKDLGKDGKKREAEKYAEMFHLGGLENHYPSQLSGGQQQRCALARIMASKPELILLDEPFSALDVSLRWKMDTVVRETIQEFGGTAILVSHNRDDVFRIADHVAVYDKGKIDCIVTKDDLFEHPETITAARLTGIKNISPVTLRGDRLYFEKHHISVDAAGHENAKFACITDRGLELCEEGAKNSFSYEILNAFYDRHTMIFRIKAVTGEEENETAFHFEADRSYGEKIPPRGFMRPVDSELMFFER